MQHLSERLDMRKHMSSSEWSSSKNMPAKSHMYKRGVGIKDVGISDTDLTKNTILFA